MELSPNLAESIKVKVRKPTVVDILNFSFPTRKVFPTHYVIDHRYPFSIKMPNANNGVFISPLKKLEFWFFVLSDQKGLERPM